MLARNTTSAPREASDSLGSNSPNTPSCVSSVSRSFRSQPYSPAQKKVLPPGTCSMSSVLTLRARSTSYSLSPKSSPTGPTTRTSVKKLAASEKCTAEPPSMRSRSPNGVLTASNAIDPTTTRVIDARRVRYAAHARRTDRGVRRPGGPPGRGHPETRARGRPGADQGRGGRHELRRHPPARKLLPRQVRPAAGDGRRGGRHDRGRQARGGAR